MDRLPFFAEYVRNLTDEEAAQVLGATVPMRPAAAQGVYGEEETARLSERFEELFRSLCDLRPEYLARENDPHEAARHLRVSARVPQAARAGGAVPGGPVPPQPVDRGPVPARVLFLRRAAHRRDGRGAGAAAGRARSHSRRRRAPPGSSAWGRQQPRQPVAGFPPAPRAKCRSGSSCRHFFNDIVLADRAAMGASGASTKTSFLQRVLLISGAALCLLLCHRVHWFRS